MLKYFYYIWNLLNTDERIELFYHFGQCILSAILYTITDWQYLIMLWIIAEYGVENILQIVVGVQLFAWLISFWYYFVKYQISLKQNYFYKLISSRHYNYILNRVSKNAPYQWICEKSSLDLAKQLDATEKGLQHVFSFITNSIRLCSIISFAIVIISWQYKACSLVFFLYFVILYVILNRKNLFTGYNDKKREFQILNQHNSLIISDNISILLDSILHGDYKKIIDNITTFNNATKKEQIKLYDHEDQTYTKIGLVLISGYICMLAIVSSLMNLSLDEYTMFFITALLTYKCINHNINELCDMYSQVRQTQLDFDCLSDVWLYTRTKRKFYEQLTLPTKNNHFDLLKDFCRYHFQKIETVEIKLYEKFIKKNDFRQEFLSFSTKNLKKLLNAYYLCNKDDMKKLENIRQFIISDYKYVESFNEFLKNEEHENILKISPKDVYFEYIKHTNSNIKKDSSTFELLLYNIHFYYKVSHTTSVPGIKYKSDIPITIKSNSHILIDGPSGSGKTTLLKIIRGIIPLDMYEEGSSSHNFVHLSIKLPGQEPAPINFTNLSNSICYCQQNSLSFTGGSVYQILSDDYISIPRDEAEISIMNKALATACVDIKFRDLEFKCSKDSISGGQKQRLTLAKNLYRVFKENKQIIILDEIDAGLDIRTAEKVIVNLNLLFKEKILFIVLHTEELKSLFKNKIKIVDGVITPGY